MKNFYFVQNDNNYELWVNGECVSDLYHDESKELIQNLVYFANIPIYKNIRSDIVNEMETKWCLNN